jgi:hypothetical protein
MIDVFIPCYNSAATIEVTISSVLAAGYNPIVLDNFSADSTKLKAREMGAKVLVFPDHHKNRVESWNRFFTHQHAGNFDFSRILFAGDTIKSEEVDAVQRFISAKSGEFAIIRKYDELNALGLHFTEHSHLNDIYEISYKEIRRATLSGINIFGGPSNYLFRKSYLLRDNIRFCPWLEWAADWHFGNVLTKKTMCVHLINRTSAINEDERQTLERLRSTARARIETKIIQGYVWSR